MKPEHHRVKNLLLDTVTLLCKNGLPYCHDLRVEGLIGITIDSSEVFIVHLNERFREDGMPIPMRPDTTNSPTAIPPPVTEPTRELGKKRQASSPPDGPPSRSRRHSTSQHSRADISDLTVVTGSKSPSQPGAYLNKSRLSTSGLSPRSQDSPRSAISVTAKGLRPETSMKSAASATRKATGSGQQTDIQETSHEQSMLSQDTVGTWKLT